MRLETWGKAAGMESFRDEEKGRVVLTLAGKVIVIDVEFSIISESENPGMEVASVKNSYAVPSGEDTNPTANTGGSTSLDGFLATNLRAFLGIVQKPVDDQDPIVAAQIAASISQHLTYLMRLDALAAQEGDTGLRWFTSSDNLASTVEKFAKAEAQALAR
jgi:hypothetical protein